MPAQTEEERRARDSRQFGGARVPSKNTQSCDLCGRAYSHPSKLLMAFSDTGEIMKRNYLKSLTILQLQDMVKEHPNEEGLPFFNMAWQNRNRTTRQYCMRCYGRIFKDSEAYYAKYAMNKKKGYAVWGVTSEWQKLREQCLGASEGRKIRKIRERLCRLWDKNKQHTSDYLSLVLCMRS